MSLVGILVVEEEETFSSVSCSVVYCEVNCEVCSVLCNRNNCKMAVERLKVILHHLKGPNNITNNPDWNLTSAVSSQSEIIEDREFRYTLNNSILTKQQRQFYEDNGYLVISNIISSEILDKCRDHFNDICQGRVPNGNITVMKEKSLAEAGAKGEYLVYKLQEILHDAVFIQYLAHPKILDYVECFTGPNITAVHSMLINKPPDVNTSTSRHPLHQDLYYFPFRPANLIVGCWTAMETTNESNGALYVIPGSHKAGELYKHDYPETDVNIAFHGVTGFENYPSVTLCMEKGDTVFLHPLLLHGSGVNTTKGFRRAISCHYAASECHLIDIKGTLQEKIGKEAEEIALKKGYILDYNSLWKLKSLVVRGTEGFTAM